jgi:flagellar motor switch protein FliN/FliY
MSGTTMIAPIGQAEDPAPQDGGVGGGTELDAGKGAGQRTVAGSDWISPSTVNRQPATASPSQTPDFLLDVRLTISVEVGRVHLPVRQVMGLGPGSVIELQRAASDPVEVLANGRCIGRGEIVVVGEQFGVRITELGPA